MSRHSLLDDMRQSFEAGRLAHSYVLTGDPRGAGAALAMDIAQLVMCEGAERPCRACASCVRVADHRHPDVTWIEPTSKGRLIRVEEMRELTIRMSRTSYEGGWKVAVLLAADRMNDSSANAFLKTLEEPPPRTLMLLVTDSPQQLLPTILSRCQRVQVTAGTRLPEAEWMDEVRELLSMGSPSSVIDAMGQAAGYERLLKAQRERIEKEDDSDDPDEDEDVQDARITARLKTLERDLFAAILLWQRDVLVARLDPETDDLYFSSDQERIAEQAAALSVTGAQRNVSEVEKAMTLRERNFAPRAVFEQMLIEFGRSAKLP